MVFLRRRYLLWLLPLGVVAATVLALGRSYPGNVAETRPDHPDAQLCTRRYRLAGGMAGAASAVAEIIQTQTTYGRHWRLAQPHAAPEGQRQTVYAEVPVVIFTDDLRVTMSQTDRADVVLLDVRSASRVGRSDFGENRRHILQLLRVLDAKFSSD